MQNLKKPIKLVELQKWCLLQKLQLFSGCINMRFEGTVPPTDPPWGGRGGPHSRFRPCFCSLCRALLGSEKALSWWLGMPEFRSAAPCCWKKVSWATVRVPNTAALALLQPQAQRGLKKPANTSTRELRLTKRAFGGLTGLAPPPPLPHADLIMASCRVSVEQKCE